MDVIGAYAPKRTRSRIETECVREARADIFSVGGAIIASLCVMLTVIAVMVLNTPTVTVSQRVIVLVLTMASWLYFLSSATERLQLVDHAVEYTSAFSARRHIPLEELEAMLLIHQGFNLERGIETIEFRRRGKKSDRIALGPCWQRHKLEAFLHSVEEALNAPELLEEVR